MLLIIRLLPIWLILDNIVASNEGSGLPETCYNKGDNFKDRRAVKRYNNITEVEGCFNKCKSDYYCKYWLWNEIRSRCFTMEGYEYETYNTNFISGKKYCHDLPSTCDCGVENTAPPNRTEKGRLHGMNYNKYTWVAELENEETGIYCEGTLISSKYIVSAAHCIYNAHDKWGGFSPPDALTVLLRRGGEEELEYLDVADYFVHEDYNYKRTVWNHPDSSNRPSLETVLQHDIVLLELDEHVNLEIYTPVCLPRKKQQFESEKATAVFTNDYNVDEAAFLKEELAIVTPSLCERKMNLTLHPGQMCAGMEEDRDHCQENSDLTYSGGPLTVKQKSQHVLRGITSSSLRCGVRDEFALFSRISYYRDWIMEHMKNPKFCQSGPYTKD